MPWIAAGAAVVGGILGNKGASDQNKSAAGMSAKQMAFQERMSNTAYQRSAKDLDAAGLNRILALGNPASTPGGSQAPVVNKMTSAVQVAQGTQQIKQSIDQSSLIRAQTQKSIDDNYIQKTRNDILRAVAADLRKPNTAKETKPVKNDFPGSYADYMESDNYRKENTAKKQQPPPPTNTIPMLGKSAVTKPPSKPELPMGAARVRSTRREQLYRWMERYPRASKKDIENAKWHIAQKNPMP